MRMSKEKKETTDKIFIVKTGIITVSLVLCFIMPFFWALTISLMLFEIIWQLKLRDKVKGFVLSKGMKDAVDQAKDIGDKGSDALGLS